MFKSNSGEPYAGKLHVRFLEEFISNCLIFSKEGGKFTYEKCSTIFESNKSRLKTIC